MALLARDLLLVAAAAVYFYYAFDFGSKALPASLQSYAWLVDDYKVVHQATSALLLPYSLFVTVFSRR